MRNGTLLSNNVELLFAAQVVANIAVVQYGLARVRGVLHEHANGHGGAGTTAEDVASLTLAGLTGGTGIAAQVVDVQLREFAHQTLTQTIRCVAVDEGAVGNEGDYATILHTVRCPANRTNIRVVDAVLIRTAGVLGIGLGDALIQLGVLLVLVIIIGAVLTRGVRRVHHNHPNILLKLTLRALTIGTESRQVQVVRRLGKLEGIRQNHTVERHVLRAQAVLLRHLAVHRLDVNRRNVVREQHNLIREQLAGVLALQVFGANQAQLQQAGDERTRAHEGLNNAHALIRERLAEGFPQSHIRRAEDIIHHRNRGEDNTQTLRNAREGVLEELIVEVLNHVLLCRRVIEVLHTALNRLVEGRQRLALLFKGNVRVQMVHHVLHGKRNRVQLGKAVPGEHRVKDRLRNQVLCQHLDSLVLINRGVQGPLQTIHKLSENGAQLAFGARLIQQMTNHRDVATSNGRNILRPVVPVLASTHLVHNLGVHTVLPLLRGEGQSRLLTRSDGILRRLGVIRADAVLLLLRGQVNGLHNNRLGVRSVQLNLVNRRVHTLIVRAKRLQHLPHHLVAFIVTQRLSG